MVTWTKYYYENLLRRGGEGWRPWYTPYLNMDLPLGQRKDHDKIDATTINSFEVHKDTLDELVGIYSSARITGLGNENVHLYLNYYNKKLYNRQILELLYVRGKTTGNINVGEGLDEITGTLDNLIAFYSEDFKEFKMRNSM